LSLQKGGCVAAIAKRLANDATKESHVPDPLNYPGVRQFNEALIALGKYPSSIVIPDHDTPAISEFPRSLTPIDHAIDADDNADFAIGTISSDAKKFRFWQVEPLINQAADLLDRGLRDRAAYDELQTKWMQLRTETIQFDYLNKIHNDEIDAGYYELQSTQSGPEKRALEQTEIGTEAAISFLAQVVKDQFGRGTLDGRITDIAEIAKLTTPANGDRVKELTTAQTNWSLAVENGQLQSDVAARNGDKASINERRHAREAKATWDTKDVLFQRRRSEVTIFMNEVKKHAMADSGGPYNYLEQMEPIRSRFGKDFHAAYSILLAAQHGLQLLYDSKGILPLIIDEPLKGKFTSFDACVSWARDAIRFLIIAGQLDQNYVLSLSVKTNMGEDFFTKALANEGDTVKLTFEVLEARFAAQRLVRLRGISACVVESTPGDTWQMTVRAPVRSIGRFVSDADAAEPNKLDQSMVPPVRLGRVQTRQSQREPDVVGLTTLHNVSPLSDPEFKTAGRWSVEVDRHSLNGTDAKSLIDVHIDLLLAVQHPMPVSKVVQP
jgi:hypothetical protein